MVELEQAELCEDGSADIFVEESGSDHEAFTEELCSAALVCKTDKGDFPFTPWDEAAAQGKRLWRRQAPSP